MHNIARVLKSAGADSGYASDVPRLSSILPCLQLAESRKKRNFDPVS